MKKSTKIKATLPTWFLLHEDPAQQWVEVPYSTLVLLSIEEDISAFSFRKGSITYLERNFDGLLFMRAWLIKLRKKPDNFKYFREHCTPIYHNYAPIRSLPKYYHD